MAPLGTAQAAVRGLQRAGSVGGADLEGVQAGRGVPGPRPLTPGIGAVGGGQPGRVPGAAVHVELAPPRCRGAGPRPPRPRCTWPALSWASGPGTSIRDSVMIGARGGVAALGPVGLLASEGGHFQAGDPLGGRHVAVQPGHQHAERGSRARAGAAAPFMPTATSALRPSMIVSTGVEIVIPSAPPRRAPGRRRAGCPPGASSAGRLAPSHRALPAYGPPTSLETQTRVMSCSMSGSPSRSANVSSISRSTMPVMRSVQLLGRDLGDDQVGVHPVEAGVRREERAQPRDRQLRAGRDRRGGFGRGGQPHLGPGRRHAEPAQQQVAGPAAPPRRRWPPRRSP